MCPEKTHLKKLETFLFNPRFLKSNIILKSFIWGLCFKKYIFTIVFSDKTEATKEILAQKCKTFSAKTVPQDSSKSQCPLGSLTVWNKGIEF